MVNVVLEGSYALIMVVLLIRTIVNVPQLLLSVESSDLHKIMKFSTFLLN